MLYETSDTWSVSEARKALAEVIEAAQTRPQRLHRHGRLVAVVVGAGAFEDFERFEQRRTGVASALAELQQICAEEDYELYVPERRDRPTPFEP